MDFWVPDEDLVVAGFVAGRELAGFADGLELEGRAAVLWAGLADGILEELFLTDFLTSDFMDEWLVAGLVEDLFGAGFAEGEVIAGLVEGFVAPGFMEGIVVVGLVEGCVVPDFVLGFVVEGLFEDVEVGRVSLVFTPGLADGRYPSGYFLLKSADPWLRVSGWE